MAQIRKVWKRCHHNFFLLSVVQNRVPLIIQSTLGRQVPFAGRHTGTEFKYYRRTRISYMDLWCRRSAGTRISPGPVVSSACRNQNQPRTCGVEDVQELELATDLWCRWRAGTRISHGPVVSSACTNQNQPLTCGVDGVQELVRCHQPGPSVKQVVWQVRSVQWGVKEPLRQHCHAPFVNETNTLLHPTTCMLYV